MRIALVALHYAEYSSRLALALAENHSVLLLLRTDNAHEELSSTLREKLNHRVQVVLIEHRKLRQPSVIAAALRVVRVVRQFKPDVVHFQEYPVDYAAWSALRLMALYPSVLTIHDHVAHSGADSKVPLRCLVYQYLLRRNTKNIIVHGETILREVSSEFRDHQHIFSINLGALGGDYSAEIKDMADTDGNVNTTNTNTEPELNTLLFFGRIEAYKGLSVLLDALDKLDAAAWGKVRLLIAGCGSALEAERERIAQKKHIEVDERFIPAEDIPALFSRCAVTVLPYLDATQSGVAAMAFSFGRPVIASATGALPEVVRDGETGLLVPPGDADSLAQAINRLISDRGLWTTLAQGARRYANSDLAWPNIAKKTLSVYDDLYTGLPGNCGGRIGHS